MRVTTIALLIAMAPVSVLADSGAPLSGGSTAGHLESPAYNTIGKTSSSRVTTMAPRKVIAPAGAIGTDSDDLTPGGRARDDDRLLLERRLDCFATPVAPDRDTRNSFTSRCPGNSR